MAQSPQKSVTSTLQKLGMLAGYIVEILASILSVQQIDFWTDSKNRATLKKNLKKVFKIEDIYQELREKWQNFYKDHNWTVDFSGVIIPKKPEGKNWIVIIIAKGLTPLRIFNMMSKLFPSWKLWNDNDFKKIISPRTADKHYAIWVRNEVEPDQDLLNHSQNMMFEKNIIIETVEERMLHGMMHFLETGKHLDIKRITITSSRSAGGDAVNVCWHPSSGRVGVNGWDPGNRHGSSGGRSAVL